MHVLFCSAVWPSVEDDGVGHGESAIAVHVNALVDAIASWKAVVSDGWARNWLIAAKAMIPDRCKVAIVLGVLKCCVKSHRPP